MFKLSVVMRSLLFLGVHLVISFGFKPISSLVFLWGVWLYTGWVANSYIRFRWSLEVRRAAERASGEYLLLDRPTSQKCLATLTMMHTRRLGGHSIDGRLRGARPPSRVRGPKSSEADQFFLEQYALLGETLPHRFHHKHTKRRQRRSGKQACISDSGSSTPDSDSCSPEEFEKDEMLKEWVLGDRGAYLRYVQTGLGIDTSKLTLRFLPPGTLAGLYEQYKAQATNDPVSYTVFWRRYRNHWRRCLKFRPIGEFTECDTCHRLKLAVEAATTIDEKLSANKALADHLGMVKNARYVEECLRSAVPWGTPSRPLVFMTDGMDQSKWAVPRMRHLQGPKSWGKYVRPRVKVQGLWMFWCGVEFFLADETTAHDSSMTVETLARGLEAAKRSCAPGGGVPADGACGSDPVARGTGPADGACGGGPADRACGSDLVAVRGRGPMPQELVVFTDNTGRENKNNTVMRYLAYLVHRGMFRCTALLNLPMGHTHNILDQLFGIVAHRLQFIDDMNDIGHIQEIVKGILSEPSLSKWFGEGTFVNSEVLTSVRDWKGYFDTLGVRLEGGMADDRTGMHAWIMMARQGATVPPKQM